MFGDKAFTEKDFEGANFALRPLPLLFEYCLAAAGKGKPYIYGYDVEPGQERRPLIIVPSVGSVETIALIDSVKELTNGKIAVFYPIKEISEENCCLLKGKQDEDVFIQGLDANLNEISHAITLYMKSEESSKLAKKYGLYPMRADTQSWFGIIAHITYFISDYCEKILNRQIKLGESINLTIAYEDTLETATAAFYAKELGMKIEKIICPAPKDSILYKLITMSELDADCVREGTFIPVALERLLYATAVPICDAFDALSTKGHFTLPADAAQKLRDAFCISCP